MPTWGPTDAGAGAAATSSGLGAGNGPHCPIGTWSGTTYRSILRWAPPAWGSWTSLDKATLKVKVTDFAHVGPRNSTILVRRQNMPDLWTKASGSQNCNSGFSGSNATQYADMVSTATDQNSFASGTSQNVWKTIDVTAMLRYYWAQGAPNICIVLAQSDSSDYSEVWSDDSPGNEPTLQIDYTVQSPPTAPTLVDPDPTGEDVPVLRPTFTWTHHDPQGDPQVNADIEVYSGATLLTTLHPATGAANTAVCNVDLPRGVQLTWRARTYDAGGAGAWSGSGAFAVMPLPVVTISPTRVMEYAAGAPRLRVNWTFTSTQRAYRVQAGAFDSGWINDPTGLVKTYRLDGLALTSGTAVPVTVSVDSYPNPSVPDYGLRGSATQSFTPRYGLTVQRRDLGGAPLNWGSPTIVATVPTGAALVVEYGSDPAANAAPASGWLPDLSSVPKNRYLFYRAWFIPTATASPVLDTITIPSDLTVTVVDKWGTTRDVAGLVAPWVVDPGEAVYGTRSMRADVSAAGPFKAYSYGVKVKTGRSYILTGLMKSLGNSGACFQLEDAAGNLLKGGGVQPGIPLGTDMKSPVLDVTIDWFTGTGVHDVNRYKTPIYVSPSDQTVYVVLVAGGANGSKAWFDAMKLEESTVATPWSPGAIGAVVMDAGGLQIDGLRGGVLRYRGGPTARDVVEGGLGGPAQNGLLFAGDTRLASPSVGALSVNEVPLRIGARIPPVPRLFTALGAGTWTKPTVGLSHIIVEVVGGGGGGGGAVGAGSGNACGSGGGAGAYARHLYTAEDLAGAATFAYTVGAGGAAPAGGAGGAGGASNFSGTGITTLQGTAGSGGAAGSNSTGNSTVGKAGGGVASGPAGAFLADGASSGPGVVRAGAYVPTGYGGSSFVGGGGGPGQGGAGEAGQAKGSGGGGGTASTASTAGGVGAPGIVIITEYYL